MDNYNTISLFSGAMGLDIGLEQAGFDIKVCIEVDKVACETINKNTNIPVINDDIYNITSDEILNEGRLKKDEVFLIAGGPPCQAFSTAGERRGFSDIRGNVILNFLRIIKEIKPKFFIMENVRGLLSTKIYTLPEEYIDEYKDILKIKGGIVYFLYNELKKYGYTISFSLFNSANYGVPQKRERIIMFGNLGEKRIPLPSPTHSEDGILGQPWTTFGQVTKDLKEEDLNYLELADKHKKYLNLLTEGQNWKDLPNDIKEKAMGKSFKLGGGKTGFYRRISYDKPAPTLVTSPTMPATMLVHPEKLRPLAIEEYRRLQQFPDNWEFAGHIREQYKQIGNAVPIGMGYVAGKTILDFYKGDYNPEREKNNSIPYSRYKNCSDFEFIPEFYKKVQKEKEMFGNKNLDNISDSANGFEQLALFKSN
ncbi:DNA cytosine methyltransferase [Natranaerofaba carboxydovora]|uniref:DNA cytosine methyltransferase n=1 Tax=Natranaerofaba carboxydovora TaxID=2742683 RepID=UPI001F13F33A|nr:DNA cytosine methyltransferase [Natranaerofaba carboxydovora]UMZ73113.1 Modification methylase HaeIII [Natranaerofaba carboxydovora]